MRLDTIRSITNQRGAAAMEFALVTPILLLIVFATIEYGWYMTQCLVISNAVAEGARAAVKAREWTADSHDTEDPIRFANTALTEALWTIKDLNAGHIHIRIIPADEAAPRRISVSLIEVPYRPITGYLGKTMLPETLAATSIMAFP